MDTDGSLTAAEGLMKFDEKGMSFYSQGVAMQFASSAQDTIDTERQGWFLGGLQIYSDGGNALRFGVHQFSRNGSVLINEDFESGLSGWTLTGSPVQSSDHKVSGDFSCKVDKDNYIIKTIAVTAGSYYHISFKVRKTAATATPSVNTYSFGYTPVGAWTLVLLIYRASTTGNIDFSFRLRLRMCGDIYTRYLCIPRLFLLMQEILGREKL
jgi:hypothetical protein